MAGNYPDVPSWRMAYDRDGTQVYHVRNGVVTQLTTTQVTNLNNESDSYAYTCAGNAGPNWITFIFPEMRDVDGFWGAYARYHTGYSSFYRAEVSPDTTNGLDGTWAQIAGTAKEGLVRPSYRNDIQSSTALNVKAFRIALNSSTSNSLGDHYWRSIHLFGEKVPGENPDRLELWHPTLDQKFDPAYLDFGNHAREQSKTKTFRVKNLSSTLTAQSVRVAMEILTDTTPPVVGQFQLSLDSASWLAQVNVGDLAPGQISQVVSLRGDLLSNAVLSLWTFRVFSDCTAWV